MRGTFERKSKSVNESTKEEGYKALAELIAKHVTIMVRTEKGRLIRERIFYKNDPNRYARCLEMAKTVDEDMLDNCFKMAVHICHPDEPRLQKELDDMGLKAGSADKENALEDIASRVTEADAREYLLKWKKIQIQNEANLDLPANQTSTLLSDAEDSEALAKCKDELFIQTGQDLIDIFAAFEHYKLDQNISEEDRRQFS